jgi:hypothetical protein
VLHGYGTQRTGLCDVGEFENLLPGTAAQLKNKCTNKVQKMIEKLLPEPQPNSEPMLMDIASAPILQNPLLAVVVCPAFPQGTKKIKFFEMETKLL